MTVTLYPIKKLLLSIVIVGIFIVSASALITIFYLAQEEKGRFLQESSVQSKLISDISTTPFAFKDKIGAAEALSVLQSYPDIYQVTIYDQKQKEFAIYNPKNLTPYPLLNLQNGFIDKKWFDRNAIYYNKIPIVYNAEKVGEIVIVKSASSIYSFTKRLFNTFLVFCITLLIIAFAISTIIFKFFLNPIIDLASKTKEIASNRNYSKRVSYEGKNEVAYLHNSINSLLEETQQLTESLEARVLERTNDLKKSLESLQIAQSQLIESEKMASLGNLVSGVAHEINTPIGNALTGASIIERESGILYNELNNQTLKKTTLESKLDIIKQSSHILIKSLNQASSLVKSFKNISVDQSVDFERKFNIKEYIQEILQTCHAQTRQKNISVELDADDKLNIYSYPGVFAQIFNNLIGNTVMHAFDDTDTKERKITISISKVNNDLIIVYKDNGKGIDETIKDSIYEPFITTKRNAGGTGLGMNIVYNLVTQKLLGSIKMESIKALGVTFTIKIPIKEQTL